MASSINSLYLLTHMTGKTSGANRTTVIGTVEMRLRTFWIGLGALVPGAILTACFYPVIGVYSFLLVPLAEFAAFYLIERRTREGLRLRTYQAMNDKRRAKDGVFYLCGQPLEVTETPFGTIQQISVPVAGISDVPFRDTPAPAPRTDFEAAVR